MGVTIGSSILIRIFTMAAKKTIPATKAMELAKGNAIDKVCSIFSLLSERSPLRLSEITRETGLNRVTALRILDALRANDFIQRSGNPPHYSFGPEVAAMTAAISPLTGLREIVRPSLIRLATLSGDVALLSIRSSLESICVDRVSGDYPINAHYLETGTRRPLGVSAASMALLAWLPPAEQDAIVEISASRVDAFPGLNREVLMEHIEIAQKKGYVIMLDVVVDRLGGMAAPIYDAQGNIIAAISVVALSERILEREDELAAALKKEQAIITRQLMSE